MRRQKVMKEDMQMWRGIAIVHSHKPLHHNQRINDPKLEQMVEDFYKHNFWDKIHGDTIESQDLADQAFDFAVNAGVSAALKLIKES